MMSLNFLNNKTILVTGGTGSFGRGFIKFLLEKTKVKKIILFSRDELKQSLIRSEFNSPRLRFFLGDVRDLQRLQRAFYKVDIVVHAAALKQVPTLEYNPFEAVKTNIIGSQNVIDAAIDQMVEKVILISTDKAVQPTNLYGSTKLCAEKLFVNGNAYSSEKTSLGCVRYGNVIGSRGSIVEILLRKNNKNKFYLTDERMTRFWMTVEQSTETVLFALSHMKGGEVFIPKIPSMKLVDLFETIIPRVKPKIIGARPGEKLHELLLTTEEAQRSVELENYFVILPGSGDLTGSSTPFKKILRQGKRLNPNFCFGSENNKNWLTRKELKNIITNLDLGIKG